MGLLYPRNRPRWRASKSGDNRTRGPGPTDSIRCSPLQGNGVGGLEHSLCIQVASGSPVFPRSLVYALTVENGRVTGEPSRRKAQKTRIGGGEKLRGSRQIRQGNTALNHIITKVLPPRRSPFSHHPAGAPVKEWQGEEKGPPRPGAPKGCIGRKAQTGRGRREGAAAPRCWDQGGIGFGGGPVPCGRGARTRGRGQGKGRLERRAGDGARGRRGVMMDDSGVSGRQRDGAHMVREGTEQRWHERRARRMESAC